MLKASEHGETRCHPTQKPVAIMEWSMDAAKVMPGMTVLDPYMGSGTTGIACIRTGRKFIGIEKDPVHFATAVERIKREQAQLLLL
jgi:DNA modification methylase